MKKVYVLGLMFSMGLSQVVLATKRTPTGYAGEGRPEWMNGMLNGVGGVVKDGESPAEAMQRKALAETGIATDPGGWMQFGYMQGEDYEVHIFAYKASNDEFYSLKTQTDEPVRAYRVEQLMNEHAVPNIQWLVLAAVESLNYGGMEIAINYATQKALSQMNQDNGSNKSAQTGQEQVSNSLTDNQSIPATTQNQTGGGTAGKETMSLEGGSNLNTGGTVSTTEPANPVNNPQKQTPESGLDTVANSTAKIAEGAAGDTTDANGKPTSNAARVMDAATQQDKESDNLQNAKPKKA